VAPSHSKQATRSFPAPLIVALVVLLCAFIGWRGYRSFSPPALQNAPLQSVNPQYTWIQEEARKSEGDFNKLPQAEQEQVMQLTRGYGPRVLKDQWAAMKH